ncbi:MAG: hypothetical protein GXP28_11380 [Planctomycetes bacterium]|nr:hypothetical protein [Planctomycetota bacterium]
METVLSSLDNYLGHFATHGHAGDLLSRWTRNMETQINVSAGDGERVEGKPSTYTDGINQWWNIRVPKKANSEPEFHDYNLNWPLDRHAEGIGSTGWDWVDRCSRWVGFDFDSISGHARGVGIDDAGLEEVRQKAASLPYVEVRKSTGGKGLHLYVLFGQDGIPTDNHTEHAALARCVLSMMSTDTGFDFSQHIDCCGGNMWIWHRKITPENEGLKLIKPTEQVLELGDLPSNWRDHIEVVTRRQSKVRLQGLDDETLTPFEKLTSGRKVVALDESHRAIIKALTETGFSCVWVQDHHLLQTHTAGIQKLFDDMDVSAKLKLKGVFQTTSEGSDPGEPNCFLRPKEDGVFQVYRFSLGTSEAKTWDQGAGKWTSCLINCIPTFASACLANGALEDPDSGEYVFKEQEAAVKAALSVGEALSIPEQLRGRLVRFSKDKLARLVVRIERYEHDQDPEGWLLDKRKKNWVLASQIELDKVSTSLALDDYDYLARKVVSPEGSDIGWRYMTSDGQWIDSPKDDLKDLLHIHGNNGAQVKHILGQGLSLPWRQVSLPFQPEYPGGRQWNLGAAQLAYEPASLAPDDRPHHPHWDLIMEHVGGDLTTEIQKQPWAKAAGILTGGDYLKAWVAAMFREPFQSLPYLFFYGPENSGKSIFFESIGWLMTKGVVDAKNTLTNSTGYNGELLGAVLCYVDEMNLSTKGPARNLKEWVTCKNLSIRKMRTDTFAIPNVTKWVHCANDQSFCPVFPGDTRITVSHVPLPVEEIPKLYLERFLRDEAPHFMRTLMDMELPELTGRMRVPVVRNASKERIEETNRTALEEFLAEKCKYGEGERVRFSRFFEKFQSWLPKDEKKNWSKIKVSKDLPHSHKTQNANGNDCYVANLKFKASRAKSHRKKSPAHELCHGSFGLAD